MEHLTDFERVRNYFGEENLPILINLILTRRPFIIDDTSFSLKSLCFFSPHRIVVYADDPDKGYILETKNVFKKERSTDQKTLLLLNNIKGEAFELLSKIPIGWVAACDDYPTTFGLPVFNNESKEFRIMLKRCVSCGGGINLNAKYCTYCGSTTRGKKGAAFSVPYHSLGKSFQFEENLALDLLKTSEKCQKNLIIKTINDLHKRAKKLIKIYQKEKDPQKIREKLKVSPDLLSRLALIVTNEYYHKLGVISQKEEILSPWCPNCGKKIKISTYPRKCKHCGWNEKIENSSKYILKIAGIKNKEQLKDIIAFLIERAKREIDPNCFDFTDITDSLAKDIGKWIYKKQLPYIVNSGLTDVYMEKLASLLFKEMCINEKSEKWVKQIV